MGSRTSGKHDCWSCQAEGEVDPNCLSCGGTGYDTQRTDEMVCPHCGAEMATDDRYNSGTYSCDECEGWVEVEIDYTPSYSTAKGKDPYEHIRKARAEALRAKDGDTTRP